MKEETFTIPINRSCNSKPKVRIQYMAQFLVSNLVLSSTLMTATWRFT